MKKSKILLLAMATVSLSACAQRDYSSYDDLYMESASNDCMPQFDDIVDEESTVKNVLVRSTDVVNYYHDNVVVENHYNLSKKIRCEPRTYVNNYSAGRRYVVPKRVTPYTYKSVRVERPLYNSSKNEGKWFFFFKLNSDYITNKEELGHLIDFAKTHQFSSLYIDAYADAETGGYYTNLQISQMRANAIINILLREGISEDRLFVRCHGSISQPYITNNLNRCVTVSTASKR